MEAATERYWRIRMKGETDLTGDVWKRNQVGIWYGGWTVADYDAAINDPDPPRYLSNLPHHQDRVRALWRNSKGEPDPTITPRAWSTIKRFWGIKDTDWVYVCFDSAIHLARICGPPQSYEADPYSEGEMFKYRPIRDKKTFALESLPDSFYLISMAGQENVFEPRGTYHQLLEILAQSADENEATARIEAMSLREWLQIVGDSAWESLCEAYLILTAGFLPTGLRVGKTLKTFDIVGRDRDGTRILAQCKKAEHEWAIEPEFAEACAKHANARVFYFAYGGCRGAASGVNVVTGKDILEWLETKAEGQRYARLLRRPEGSP